MRIFNTQTNKNKIKALALIWNDCTTLKVKYNVFQRVFFFDSFLFIEHISSVVFQRVEDGETFINHKLMYVKSIEKSALFQRDVGDLY